MDTLTYTGQLQVKDYGEAYDILYLLGYDEPLAQILGDSISKRFVTVRYWISDQPVTKDAAIEFTVRQAMGMATASIVSHYSEITGYLWTDEEIMIGGHDLLRELQSHVGRWLILEIDLDE